MQASATVTIWVVWAPVRAGIVPVAAPDVAPGIAAPEEIAGEGVEVAVDPKDAELGAEGVVPRVDDGKDAELVPLGELGVANCACAIPPAVIHIPTTATASSAYRLIAPPWAI